MAISDFMRGYDAAASCEKFDSRASREWRRGWHQYQDDMTRSEQCKWI